MAPFSAMQATFEKPYEHDVGLFHSKYYCYTTLDNRETHPANATPEVSSGKQLCSKQEPLFMNREQSPPLGSIQFLSGPLAGKTFPIRKPVLTIGRDEVNDIVVFDPKVSRRHALIRYNNGNWSIENHSQKNAMFVNQQNVQQAILQHNSVVSLGDNTSFLMLIHTESQQPAVLSPTPAAIPVPPPPPAFPGSSVQFTPQSSPALMAAPPSGSSSGYVMSGQVPERTVRGGMASLEISSNIQREKLLHPLTKPVINIGRNPTNDIVINEPVVSGFHAQIVRDGNQWVLIHPPPGRDKTLNGLLYQGRQVQGGEQFRKPLERGDIFRIGDEYGTLVTLAFDDGSGLLQDIVPEMRPIPLGAPLITIGRALDNMVVLNHPLVSGHHARLEGGPGGYRIVDMNSTNRVYVNGQQITAQILNPGDEIRIGPFRLPYTGTELNQYDESSTIRIDALDLKKIGNNNVILLNGISFAIPPRKFVALVGGSGAGKSTLMDALNGLRPAQEGTVLYNGQNYYENLAAFSTQLGYVPQDDIVHRELTVERALYYAAKMRLPGDFTKEQIQQRINEVLDDVEMSERRYLLVNKLSGGQRKRVSIALELLANPSVFFLDEPTSGLDPGLDRKMMFLLRRLADRGRTIILVTHATNNINVCDYVCFLSQGGRLAYFGPPNDAKAFFNKTDFAEIYSALEPTKENPNIPQEAEARFRGSQDYYRYVVQPLQEGAARRASGTQSLRAGTQARRRKPWRQFALLSTRYMELLRNDVGNLLLLLLQAPVIALLLVIMVRTQIGADIFGPNQVVQCMPLLVTASGPIGLPGAKQGDIVDCKRMETFLRDDPAGKKYADENDGVTQALQDFILPGSGGDAQTVLFIMAFAAVMFGCISGSREIVKEAHIYRRERAVDLGILPYMFSKIGVLGALSLLQSALLLFIVHVAESLQQGVFLPVLLETYITLTLCSLAGLLTGLAISAMAPNNDWAISFVPIILIPQVIFSGAIIPFKDWFMQIFAIIFPTRWALVALCSSIGVHSDKLGEDKLFGDDFTYHGTLFSTFTTPDATNRIIFSWIALVAIIVALTIVIGIALKAKDVRT